MSIWDEPGMSVGGDYVTFNNIGDTVSGVVLDITAHRWEDGKVSPQLLLDVDGEQKTVTAGQVRLKAALAEQKPEAGDRITITLTDIEKRQGGKTLKHFDVVVGRGGAAAPKAPAGTGAVISGGGDLTKEQREAMALLGIEVPS